MPEQSPLSPALRKLSVLGGVLAFGMAGLGALSLSGELGPAFWADAIVAVTAAELGVAGVALLRLSGSRRSGVREWLPVAVVAAALLAVLVLWAFYRYAGPWRGSLVET